MGGTLSFRIGAILLVGFVVLQSLLLIALRIPGGIDDRSRYGLPSPQALAQMVRSIEAAGPKGADLLAESYNGSLFSVEVRPEAPRDFSEVPRSMSDLAADYRQALPDHNAVVDGGPGRLHKLLGDRARPMRFLVPIRLTVWLRDGRVLVMTGRPSAGLRAYLAQRSFIGLAGGALLLFVLWLALRQTTRPLRRLTDHVRALGSDLHAPDAAVEGSREIRALGGAFNDMKSRIAQLVEERTFILAGIAHDMRTFLTRLKLRAEFIGDPDQRARAETDLDQMAALLDDSLLFASIERRSDTVLQSVDLSALTRELVEAHMERARISVDLPPVSRVKGDATQLARIFSNLVDNALRHAPHVHAAIDFRDGRPVWQFDDDGPGVPPDKLGTLGHAFARIDPSRDRRSGGAGLGLAIVRALAEAMGGSVTFARSPMGGLAVHVVLTSDDPPR